MEQALNPVRTIQHHLRLAGALLAEQHFDAAAREADAALAIDAASLPAQALKERITALRAQHAVPAPRAREARFVPSGVDAQSWIGFEARIQERRYRALMETIGAAIVNGDGFAARAALEEARELRPDAPDLAALAARVAMLPVAMPATDVSATIWSRAFGAVALLLVGVAFLVGIEWLRPSQRPDLQAPIAAPAPQPTDSPDLQVAMPPGPGAPAATADTAPAAPAVPVAIVREPRSIGTVGVTRIATVEESGSAVAPRPSFQPTGIRDDALPSDGEIPDDYVAAPPRRQDRVVAIVPPPAPAPAPAAAPYANVVRQPTSVVNTAVAPAATPTSATVAAVAPRADESRVAQVLNEYARAYGDLNASAAHAVWPSVDEHALARAFSSLASQRVSFDTCDINVSGATANASCRGRASYVAKVGSREPRSEARTWNFELRRDGDAWMIENAEARRAADTQNR